jgi:hypothetical protein
MLHILNYREALTIEFLNIFGDYLLIILMIFRINQNFHYFNRNLYLLFYHYFLFSSKMH